MEHYNYNPPGTWLVGSRERSKIIWLEEDGELRQANNPIWQGGFGESSIHHGESIIGGGGPQCWTLLILPNRKADSSCSHKQYLPHGENNHSQYQQQKPSHPFTAFLATLPTPCWLSRSPWTCLTDDLSTTSILAASIVLRYLLSSSFNHRAKKPTIKLYTPYTEPGLNTLLNNCYYLRRPTLFGTALLTDYHPLKSSASVRSLYIRLVMQVSQTSLHYLSTA